MEIQRRDFLTSAAAAATLTGLGAMSGRALAAGDPDAVRIGVIGLNGRGQEHLKQLGKNVVAVCDVDKQVLSNRAKSFADRRGHEVETFTDYRRMLERDDINAVTVATPNHSHSMIAIAAIQAGKDVYCEKPVSHNVWEGRQLVAAARESGKIVQCGTQSRSSPALQQAEAFVRSGGLGKVRYVVGTCYKPRKPIGKLDSPLAIPDQIDYDLWCGPAEKRDLFRPQLHYDWHWDFNTGNGDMGNQGIHQMDIARWFLGEDRIAPRTISIGGRLGYEDAADTPNSQVVLHDYEAAPLIFETRGLPRSKQAQSSWDNSMDTYRGTRIGVLVQCERGHLVIPDSYREVTAYDLQGKTVQRWTGGPDHFGNWLGAVVAQDASMLNAPIHEGHLSSALCHTGSVSHQLGSTMVADEIAERIAGDELLSNSFDRMAGHLRSNGVDIDHEAEALTLGASLQIDTETERYIGNEQANQLFTREYRDAHRVPDLGA